MTATAQLPTRIANKINSIDSHKLLRAIREARIRRNDNLSTSHKTFWRRDKIMLACLEQLEEDCGTEIEFDAVAIRCDYSEHHTALEAAKEYGFNPARVGSEEETEKLAIEWLQDKTEVIEFSGGVIIRSF